MNNVNVIDQFTNTFSQYIDSGFGLVGGDVHWLAATLIAIDMTLAALFWVLGGADDILARLIKKVLYVGAFAFIITNFNSLAAQIFHSFAGLGLTASGSGLSEGQLVQPGRVAHVGIDSAKPMFDEIGKLSGFPQVFTNIDTIAVLLFAWFVLVISFFVLSIQVFVAIIEFKLTTLAGFILVPFALWNKTAFLAEKVLGNVVSSGVKILVLAVIVGIGTGLFTQFQAPAGSDPTMDEALAMCLAAMTLLGLGIFGPGIAGGLISGAPQLGAGAAVGAAAAGAGLVVAGGAGAIMAGRFAASTTARELTAATSLASGARDAYTAGSAGQEGLRGVASGLSGVARAGGEALAARFKGASQDESLGSAEEAARSSAEARTGPPTWASKLSGADVAGRSANAAVQTLRSADRGASGAGPDLSSEET